MTVPADDFPRVALVHDWLTGMRGGERVLEILCRMFPAAPIYTLVYSPESVSELIRSREVHASFLQRVPGIARRYRWFLPAFPAAVEQLRIAPVDIIISTSHCVAKGIKPPPGARHLCYCFTPMRYAWVFYEEYFGRNPFKQALFKPVLAGLRRWDLNACSRVDRFITLSKHVRERIQRFYGREADVVYPPVNTEYWTPPPGGTGGNGGYDLAVSALVPYKRLDLAVRTYAASGAPLKIAGAGTEYDTLRNLAGSSRNIEFLGRVSDADLRELYRGCRALIFPGEEDFGLVPVEAQACGRPVVAFGKGGAAETVQDGVTGVLFHEQTPAALQAAVDRCAGIQWDTSAICRHAGQFSEANFIAGMRREIQLALAQSQSQG